MADKKTKIAIIRFIQEKSSSGKHVPASVIADVFSLEFIGQEIDPASKVRQCLEELCGGLCIELGAPIGHSEFGYYSIDSSADMHRYKSTLRYLRKAIMIREERTIEAFRVKSRHGY